MRLSGTLITAILFLVSMTGCQRPNTASFRGLTEAEVIERLGEPERRFSARIGDRFFGPSPAGLRQGEPFTSLIYRIGGDIYGVNLVPAEVYRRESGEATDTDDWRILDVNHTPKGVIY